MQVSISSITIPPHTLRDFHQKFAPTLWLSHPSICPRGGDLLGQLLRGGHWSINDVCFWNFCYNGKNWQLTTLWGLLVSMKFYTFLKKIIQSQIEPKLKIKMIENVKQFDCQAFHIGSTLENLPVYENNCIKEIVTVLLITDF